MRSLAVVVLGACSFTPGVLPTPGGMDARDDSQVDIDAPETPADASPDGTPPAAAKVRQLDIVDAKVTGAQHTNFPVLVSISGTWLRSKAFVGDVAGNDGFDIWFSQDQLGAVPLAHHVEDYGESAGTLLAWVKLPLLTPSTVFYIHYGDPAITTSQESPIAVWDGGYELVAHMSGVSDATNKASAVSSSTGAAVAGKINLALTFNGTTNYIDYGSDAELDNVFTGGGTVECWFNPSSFGEATLGRLMDKNRWFLSVDSSGNVDDSVGFQHFGDNGTGAGWFGPANSVAIDDWHHVAVVFDKGATANDAAIYINGALVSESQIGSAQVPLDTDAASSLFVGNNDTDGVRAFAGLIDELRVSAGSRDADWIATQYRNQFEPATFLVPGPEL